MAMQKWRTWATRRVTWLSLRQLCELREVLSLASGLITPLVTREGVMGQTVRDINPLTGFPSSWKFGIQCCINHMQFLHVFMYLYTSFSEHSDPKCLTWSIWICTVQVIIVFFLNLFIQMLSFSVFFLIFHSNKHYKEHFINVLKCQCFVEQCHYLHVTW